MDQKTWLWRKRSLEKTIVAKDEAEFSLKGNEAEMLHYEKQVALERSVKNLHEKLASVLCECNAKDKLIADYAKVAKEAITGQKKAEAELAIQKQELDEALQQKQAANERLIDLNAALKDCMQKLNSAREEQDQRIHEAVMKTSRELEKGHKKLEEKFTETSKMLANESFENSQLNKALLVKEKLIEDVSKQMSLATAEFNTLMARLDSTENENALLKYEFRMLEKELEIRNGEREYNRQSADALHKQHLESVKKIVKLEAECQRLRVLVRKRLPGPAALAKMRSEVEFPDRRISFMIERLCEVEEENKILKETANNRDDELLCLRTAFAQMASKLSKLEDQLEDDSKIQKSMSNSTNYENGHKMIGVSDMSLMDDFVEMEKLAIVSVDASINEPNGHHPELAIVSIDAPINDWLQNVLKAILDQNRTSRRSLDEILEEIRIALQSTDHASPKHAEICKSLPISGYITWKSPTVEENEGLISESSNEKCFHNDWGAENVALKNQLQGTKTELESLRESKRMVEDQIENQMLINEDLDTQLTVAKVQLNEVLQKLSSLAVELEDRNHCCEELEATCLELQFQLQLESVSNKEVQKGNVEQHGKLLQTGWEITAASAKLAECQETILNLGKQLKALASPKKAVVFDEVLSTTLSHHSSLRDHMLAEDGVVDTEDPNSPKTKEIISSTEKRKPFILHSSSYNALYEVKNAVPGSLAIVPSKKRSGGSGLLRKLLFRKKRGSSKKKPLLFAA